MKKLFFSFAILAIVMVNSFAGTKQGQATANGTQNVEVPVGVPLMPSGTWFGLSADAYSTGNGTGGYAYAKAYFTLKDNTTNVSHLYAYSISGQRVYLNSYYINPTPQQNPDYWNKKVVRADLIANTYAPKPNIVSWADATVSW